MAGRSNTKRREWGWRSVAPWAARSSNGPCATLQVRRRCNEEAKLEPESGRIRPPTFLYPRNSAAA